MSLYDDAQIIDLNDLTEQQEQLNQIVKITDDSFMIGCFDSTKFNLKRFDLNNKNKLNEFSENKPTGYMSILTNKDKIILCTSTIGFFWQNNIYILNKELDISRFLLISDDYFPLAIIEEKLFFVYFYDDKTLFHSFDFESEYLAPLNCPTVNNSNYFKTGLDINEILFNENNVYWIDDMNNIAITNILTGDKISIKVNCKTLLKIFLNNEKFLVEICEETEYLLVKYFNFDLTVQSENKIFNLPRKDKEVYWSYELDLSFREQFDIITYSNFDEKKVYLLTIKH